MRTRPMIVVLAAFSASVTAASARNDRIDVLNYTPPPVYEGQSVVRVRADSAGEIRAALELGEGLWSEGAGTARPFDIQVRADRIDDLQLAGLETEVLIADLQARADADWAEIQAVERFDRTRPPAHPPGARGGNPHDESWFEAYKQLPQIEAYLGALAGARPDLAFVSDVGGTIQGRDIYSITITGPDQPGNAASDRPVILWHGGQHAREWISPMTVTYLASRLVGDYDTDPVVRGLVDSVRFVIVPVSNPDGYLYTWAGERYWRKNRRPVGFGDFGVDLNRNWGYEWGGAGSSGDPSSDVYHGASAFSEPETQTLRDLAFSYGSDLVAHIDYHSYSQLILWPFGYAEGVQTPEPDRTFFDTLATDLSGLILSESGVFYDPIQSWELYAAAGASCDWFYGALDAKSICIELRPDSGDPDGFNPPASEILPCARENWSAAKLFAERTTQALSFAFTPPGVVPTDTPTPVDFTVVSGIETFDPASPSLFARTDGGAFVQVAATPLGGGGYRATLPATPCGGSVEFYLQATTLNAQAVTFPAGGASAPFIADAVTIGVSDDMEGDTGWTVGAPGDGASTGVWERTNPQTTEAQPGDDRTPDGVNCWITDGRSGSSVGTYDIDGGNTTLTSPALDATGGAGDAVLVYWRWYSNNAGASPGQDTMPVLISGDNGASWVTLETVDENAGAWVEKRSRIADFVTPGAQVRVRFIAGDLGDGSIVEAGVDDLRIEYTGCDNAPTADLAPPFGVLDFFDVTAFLNLYNARDPAADFDQNGQWDFFDVSAFLGLYNAGL